MRAPKIRIQAAQPPPLATRKQAIQLLGGTCTTMSASCCCCCRSVLLLLWQRKPAPAKRGTGYQKGGASRNFRPAGRQRVTQTCQSFIFWPRGWGLSMSNYPTCTHESSWFYNLRQLWTRLFESSCFHGEALTVALAVASLQRALHRTKNVEISITFGDPYQKRLRKPWKFLFFFFSPRPLC